MGLNFGNMVKMTPLIIPYNFYCEAFLYYVKYWTFTHYLWYIYVLIFKLKFKERKKADGKESVYRTKKKKKTK